MYDLDAIITSTSRPQYLKRFIDSIFKHLHYSGNIRWHIHEGATNWDGEWKQFEDTKNYIYNSGIFESVQITSPNTNKAEALMKLKDKASSKYILYFEDDHEYYRDIDLDSIIEVMDKYPQINQLCFNKETLVGENRKLPKPNKKLGYSYFHYETRWFENLETVVADRWHWIGSVWRKEFVMPRWFFEGGYCTKKFNHKLKPNSNDTSEIAKEWDANWLEENIGSYILMPIYCRHLSWDQRTKRSLL